MFSLDLKSQSVVECYMGGFLPGYGNMLELQRVGLSFPLFVQHNSPGFRKRKGWPFKYVPVCLLENNKKKKGIFWVLFYFSKHELQDQN